MNIEYSRRAITAYVAGSAADRGYLSIAAECWLGEGIAVVSSWLWGPFLDNPYPRTVCCAADCQDLLSSDILLVEARRSPSTTGGFWTEFGMYLMTNKPVILACRSNCNNPFAYHHNVVRFHGTLSRLKGQDIKRIHRDFYRPSA